MNYKKSINGMSYELIGPDPFNHSKVLNNLTALRGRQIARLSKGSRLFEPIWAEILKLVYRGWFTALTIVFWLLNWVDAKFREFADI